MEFVVDGARHTFDAAAARSALRGMSPDDVFEHRVDVDGVRRPPKRLFPWRPASTASCSPRTPRCGSSGVSRRAPWALRAGGRWAWPAHPSGRRRHEETHLGRRGGQLGVVGDEVGQLRSEGLGRGQVEGVQ